MPLYAKSLKHSARQAMRDAAPPAFLVTLVYLLLTQVLANVVYAVVPDTSSSLLFDQGGWLPLFLTILLSMYQSVMSFGYSCWALHTARGEQSGLGALLDGFGMVGRVLLMEVRISLCVLAWGLLLAGGYLMLLLPVILLTDGVGAVVYIAVLTALFYAATLVIGLRYALAHFLLCDYPEAGAGRAVRRSVEMLRGHMWELCRLYLSFWPWYLLTALLSLAAVCVSLLPMLGQLTGLLQSGSLDGFSLVVQTAISGTLATALSMLISTPVKLFFQPYRSVSVANFYRELSGERTAQATF